MREPPERKVVLECVLSLVHVVIVCDRCLIIDDGRDGAIGEA